MVPKNAPHFHLHAIEARTACDPAFSDIKAFGLLLVHWCGGNRKRSLGHATLDGD
jgi:hypothetical protein